jgi:hypothetical protein
VEDSGVAGRHAAGPECVSLASGPDGPIHRVNPNDSNIHVEDAAMKSIATLLFFATILTTPACHSDPAASNAARAAEVHPPFVTQVIDFHNQDARVAANYARAEFGRPPMDAEVQVRCDGKTNAWIVQATESDMTRVMAIAARYDQPGDAPWSKAK